MPTPETTLDQAPIGQPVRVVSIAGDDGIARRLADLGVRPGIAVECLRRAPLGDPSVFELCGYQLCLRRTESARVRVVPIEAGTGRRGHQGRGAHENGDRPKAGDAWDDGLPDAGAQAAPR